MHRKLQKQIQNLHLYKKKKLCAGKTGVRFPRVFGDKFGEELCDKFGDEFSESPNLVMN